MIKKKHSGHTTLFQRWYNFDTVSYDFDAKNTHHGFNVDFTTLLQRWNNTITIFNPKSIDNVVTVNKLVVNIVTLNVCWRWRNDNFDTMFYTRLYRGSYSDLVNEFNGFLCMEYWTKSHFHLVNLQISDIFYSSVSEYLYNNIDLYTIAMISGQFNNIGCTSMSIRSRHRLSFWCYRRIMRRQFIELISFWVKR